MDLRQLRYFIAVAECLHFGKAAERLFMAQPPLSRQIKQLEEELGVTLFNRNKRKVMLTTQGDFLYQEALKVFTQLEAIQNSLKLIDQGTAGQISIGYVGAAMHCILPELLVRLRTVYPDVNTVLRELTNDKQIQAIGSGELDVGFLRTPVRVDELVVRTIHKETFSVVLPLGDDWPNGKETTLADLADKPFIAFSRECGPGLIDPIIRICNKNGFSPRIVHETSQIHSIVRLVESGLGYSVVPTSVCHGYDLRVRFVELDRFNERAELAMVYKKTDLQPIVRNFVRLATSN
ncbi:LysR family transcriptional regulator [bacterium]|nr:LysR family transcriptional regulator [bacterium]